MGVGLERITEIALEIMIICDVDGKIKNVSDIALEKLEYSKSEINELSIEALFLDKTFSIKDALEKSRLEPIVAVTSIYRKNSSCFPIKLKITYDSDDNLFFIAAIDYTEVLSAKKEADYVNEKIREAMKIKDEFTANVTHELRTPVNGIKGHTQYLMLTELTKDQSKELNIINECCLNMEKLINNILDFSKLEAGKFALSKKEFSFAECMNYITQTNGKLIEDKGLRFIVNIDNNIPPVLYGDDFRIVQIMNNLLSNALKFTSKGYIAIEVNKSMQIGRDVELFFMVMDTGIGIQPEKKDALFQSFTQADASISRSYGGTGLGLAITKQLVELMDGSIRLESEYGKGSTFSFSVRMRIPDSCEIDENANAVEMPHIDHGARIRQAMEESDRMSHFGSDENIREIAKISEKLLLCIDLENYEKAEQFADSLKSLVLDGPPELKQIVFRIQMMVRKEDGEHAREYYEKFLEIYNKSE